MLSQLSVAEQKPRQFLDLIVLATQFHCSHKFLRLLEHKDNLKIRYGIQLKLPDSESTHVVQQYVLAILTKIFLMSEIEPPYFNLIEMVPHPVHGFAHLKPWIGEQKTRAPEQGFEVTFAKDVANSPMVEHQSEIAGRASPENHRKLRTDGSVSESIAFLVESMMRKTKPTLARIARSSGMSQRTLQRVLASEHREFSAILDNARKACPMKTLVDGELTMAELSARLGYAPQATLSRALRRW